MNNNEENRWIILNKNINKKAYWLCMCSCGSNIKKIIYKYDIINNKSKSCGCIRKEITIKKILNTVKLHEKIKADCIIYG